MPDARKAKTKGFIQMKEGVWYAIQYDIEVSECCDCGLVHRTYWKIERGRIYWKAAIDKRLTKKARQRLGIEIKSVRPRAVVSTPR